MRQAVRSSSARSFSEFQGVSNARASASMALRARRCSRGRCPPCRSTVRISAAGGWRSISLDEAHKFYMDGKTPFVDVRSPKEFSSDAISRAKNIPLRVIPSNIPLGAIDIVLERGLEDEDLMPPFNKQFEAQIKAALGAGGKGQTAVFVCSNGARSSLAVELLTGTEEYDNLVWLDGGVQAWLEAYSPKGVPRKRVQAGVFRDSGPLTWTDSSEEQRVLPATSRGDKDLP